MIYIIKGQSEENCGEDQYEWDVCYFKDKQKAEDYLKLVQDEIDKLYAPYVVYAAIVADELYTYYDKGRIQDEQQSAWFPFSLAFENKYDKKDMMAMPSGVNYSIVEVSEGNFDTL